MSAVGREGEKLMRPVGAEGVGDGERGRVGVRGEGEEVEEEGVEGAAEEVVRQRAGVREDRLGGRLRTRLGVRSWCASFARVAGGVELAVVILWSRGGFEEPEESLAPVVVR